MSQSDDEHRHEIQPKDERTQALWGRYMDAAKAVQRGVRLRMEVDPADTQPASLRMGVNSALIDMSALGRLLVRKGLISEEDYFEALATAMEAEVASYEKWFADRGHKVILG